MAKALEEVKEEKNSRQRRNLRAQVLEKNETGPLRMHFHHSGAKIKGCEQNTDIINSDFFIRLQRVNTLFKLG